MSLRCGIVGLPNVGKSTIFNALTAAGIAAENYPFCTIEPNSGMVPVPDARLDALAKIVNPQAVLPATVEFVDIAGLVRGASQGEGLGNQFLSHIRETHAILHVVRCFQDENVVHVEGSIDPIRDIETIETELGLADLDTMERRVERARRNARGNAEGTKEALAFFEALHTHLAEGKPARAFSVPDTQQANFRECFLLTAKPILYVTNVDEATIAAGNVHTAAVEARAKEQGARVVRLCGKIEAELAELGSDERLEFLRELGLTEPGLNRLIHESYSMLGYITYFTAGEKEVRAWTIPAGATAPQAASVIHTDFEKKFIRAEVIAFDDYIAGNGEAGAKAKGKMRVEGKDYIVHDGDVIYFRIGG